MCIKLSGQGLYEGIQYEIADRWQSTGHVSAINDMQVALRKKTEQYNCCSVTLLSGLLDIKTQSWK